MARPRITVPTSGFSSLDSSIASIAIDSRYRAYMKLRHHCFFVRLKPGSKVPLEGIGKKNSIDGTGWNAFEKLPDDDLNVACRPIGRMVVFDFDADKNVDYSTAVAGVDEQVKDFQDVFGFDFSNDLRVRTPSGGLHVFVLWGKDIPLPRNTKFRTFGTLSVKGQPDVDLAGRFNGDIRSANTNGYVVFPGSVIDGRVYTVENIGGEIHVQRKFACNRFMSVVNDPEPLIDEGPTLTDDEIPPGGNLVAGNAFIRSGSPCGVTGSGAIPNNRSHESAEWLSELESMLAKKNHVTWFSKRAFIYGILACCHDDYSIARICGKLGLNKDTSAGNREISHREVVYGFRNLESFDHKNFCDFDYYLKRGAGTTGLIAARKQAARSRTAEENSLIRAEFLKRNRTAWRTPRVIDMSQVLNRIYRVGINNKVSKHTHLAASIMEFIVQPWFNFGVSTVLLGNDFIASFFNVDLADVTLAKRLLNRRGIIKVTRHTGKGILDPWDVTESFISYDLTRNLRGLLRNNGRETLWVEFKTRTIFSPETGELAMEFTEDSPCFVVPENAKKGDFKFIEPALNLWNYVGSKELRLGKVTRTQLVSKLGKWTCNGWDHPYPRKNKPKPIIWSPSISDKITDLTWFRIQNGERGLFERPAFSLPANPDQWEIDRVRLLEAIVKKRHRSAKKWGVLNLSMGYREEHDVYEINGWFERARNLSNEYTARNALDVMNESVTHRLYSVTQDLNHLRSGGIDFDEIKRNEALQALLLSMKKKLDAGLEPEGLAGLSAMDLKVLVTKKRFRVVRDANGDVVTKLVAKRDKFGNPVFNGKGNVVMVKQSVMELVIEYQKEMTLGSYLSVYSSKTHARDLRYLDFEFCTLESYPEYAHLLK